MAPLGQARCSGPGDRMPLDRFPGVVAAPLNDALPLDLPESLGGCIPPEPLRAPTDGRGEVAATPLSGPKRTADQQLSRAVARDQRMTEIRAFRKQRLVQLRNTQNCMMRDHRR